jgi:hypothetical protein
MLRNSLIAFVCIGLLAGSAWAQSAGGDKGAPAAAPAGSPDMSKMGPWSRKPTNEAATKKEVIAFFKQMEENEKKMDVDAMLAAIDFPVTMMTDDSKGVPKVEQWSKEQYGSMMKGMMSSMPKDMKTTHKPTITVLSDSLVNVTDDFTITQGKNKMSGRSMSVLVKRDGKWMWKVMGEAGWGDMPSPGASATPPPAK